MKCIFFRTLGVITPVAIFGIYLISNNIWYEFIDYTILGIKTFSNKISYVNLVKGNYGIIISILSIIVPIFIVYMYIKTVVLKLKTKDDKILFVLFAYSVASLIVIYPISDSIHFLIGIIPSLVAIVFVITTKVFTKISIKILNYLYYMLLMLLMLLNLTSTIELYNYFKNISKYSYVQNFKYISVTTYNSLKEIDEFIINNEKQGKEVYILDANAALYMIPLNKYNKDYDMFNKGNLGARR
ncbi:MAG: hypothetical protein E7310_05955 [Clostridiales bacterium]|nr:hypothetical protein [Clostridiales bacterium]